MAKRSKAVRAGFAGLLVVLLAACQPVFRNHGWAPSDADLAAITVGRDTTETVRAEIGAPGAAGVLSNSAWYYVESRWQHGGYREPVEVSREVVAISFSPSGVVSNVERFGLQDGEVIALSRRTTQTGVTNLSFLRQLMGSLGRLNPASMLSE